MFSVRRRVSSILTWRIRSASFSTISVRLLLVSDLLQVAASSVDLIGLISLC